MNGKKPAQSAHTPRELESVPQQFRRWESRAEADAWFIIRMGRPIGLYYERNGRGMRYYALKYRVTGRQAPGSRYLGQLSEETVRALREEIARVKAVNAREGPAFNMPTEQVKMLGQLVRSAKQMADRIARQCGWRFKGYVLQEETYANGNG